MKLKKIYLRREREIKKEKISKILKINFFISFLFLFYLIGNVCAFGITPAKSVVDFSSGKEISGKFSVVNSEKENLDLAIHVTGDLAENIYLRENKFVLSSEENSREIEYILKLPKELAPGLNSGEIVVTSFPRGESVSEAFVGAAIAISYKIGVNVPYPGKYIDAELNIVGANAGEDVTFVIPLFSRGEHDVISAKANFDIYNQFNEKVDSFESSDISIDSGEKKELVRRWRANVPVGKYFAKVSFIYDGVTVNLDGFFSVGQQELELQSVEVRNFKLGEIAKFEELIENKWSERIENVFTEIRIYDQNGKLVSEVKSAMYDFEPFSKQAILSYWDSAGAREGEYRAEILLKYHGKSVKNNLDMDVSKNKIHISGLTGYVLSEGDSSDEGNGFVALLIVIVIILVIINLFWFFLFKKKFKN